MWAHVVCSSRSAKRNGAVPVESHKVELLQADTIYIYFFYLYTFSHENEKVDQFKYYITSASIRYDVVFILYWNHSRGNGSMVPTLSVRSRDVWGERIYFPHRDSCMWLLSQLSIGIAAEQFQSVDPECKSYLRNCSNKIHAPKIAPVTRRETRDFSETHGRVSYWKEQPWPTNAQRKCLYVHMYIVCDFHSARSKRWCTRVCVTIVPGPLEKRRYKQTSVSKERRLSENWTPRRGKCARRAQRVFCNFRLRSREVKRGEVSYPAHMHIYDMYAHMCISSLYLSPRYADNAKNYTANSRPFTFWLKAKLC